MIAEYTVGTEYVSEAGAEPELVQWSAIVTYAILSELARGEFETYGAALAGGDLGTYGSTLAPRELTRRLRTDAQVGLLGRNSLTGGIGFGVVIDLADTEWRGVGDPEAWCVCPG